MDAVKAKGCRVAEDRIVINAAVGNTSRFYCVVKRLFDIAGAVIGVLLLALPMLIISVFIILDSGFPIIFRQDRLGKNGKAFVIYKFRSMRQDAETDGPQWAEPDDTRCTKVGRMLRKSRLDELPQLWNILIGDMSFVGPRPDVPGYADQHGYDNRNAAPG